MVSLAPTSVVGQICEDCGGESALIFGRGRGCTPANAWLILGIEARMTHPLTATGFCSWKELGGGSKVGRTEIELLECCFVEERFDKRSDKLFRELGLRNYYFGYVGIGKWDKTYGESVMLPFLLSLFLLISGLALLLTRP
jgi:hypothetical protein